MGEIKQHKPSSLGKRTESRMAAVKALYASDINEKVYANEESKDPDELALEIISCYDDNEEGLGNVKLDEEFFLKIVRGVCKNQQVLDEKIVGFLNEGWSMERLGPVIRSILRAAVCELMLFDDIPLKVIINEYVNITRAFFSEKEVGFANGILDKIGHDVREGE